MSKNPEDNIQWMPDPVSYINISDRTLTIINRILSKCDVVDRGHDTPCWEWLGSDSGKGNGAGRGYGRIKIDSVVSATHRVMFVCYHGYLPPGRDLDHLCENRSCCNPDHLESVTRKENIKRRDKSNGI